VFNTSGASGMNEPSKYSWSLWGCPRGTRAKARTFWDFTPSKSLKIAFPACLVTLR